MFLTYKQVNILFEDARKTLYNMGINFTQLHTVNERRHAHIQGKTLHMID